MTAPPTQRGFSLLDALLAALLLTSGVLALAAFQSRLLRNSIDTQARSVASNVAQSVLDEFGTLSAAVNGAGCGFDELASGTLGDDSPCAQQVARGFDKIDNQTGYRNGLPFRVSWQVTDATSSQSAEVGLKRLTVTVTWPDRLAFSPSGDAQLELLGQIGRLPPSELHQVLASPGPTGP